MNPCRLDWQTEFTDQIDDLLRTQAVQNLKYYSHHHRVTRYEHVLLVAQLSSMTCTTAERTAITYATPGITR